MFLYNYLLCLIIVINNWCLLCFVFYTGAFNLGSSGLPQYRLFFKGLHLSFNFLWLQLYSDFHFFWLSLYLSFSDSDYSWAEWALIWVLISFNSDSFQSIPFMFVSVTVWVSPCSRKNSFMFVSLLYKSSINHILKTAVVTICWKSLVHWYFSELSLQYVHDIYFHPSL